VCSYAKDTEVSSVVSGIYYLGKELGYVVDEEEIIQDLNYLGSSPFISEKIKPDSVIKAVRNQGMFINGFNIKKEDMNNLLKVDSAFLIYLEGEGYVVVKDVTDKGSLQFECILSDGKIKYLEKEKFLSLWNGDIFCLPLMNIMAKRLNSGSAEAENRFVVIYSYHTGEDFSKLSKILDELRYDAQRQSRRLIYLDELGLIPDESVKSKMKLNNLSKKEAFLDIKQSIIREDEMLRHGIPVNIPNPFYSKLFSYLAQYKIKSIVEDLDYNLWKQIVRFDNLKLHDKATNSFFVRDLDEYVDLMKEHTKGFWEYNVKRRDKHYRDQIEDIMSKYPNALIFVLRGIGHYGMEEDINTSDFSVQTYVFCDGKFNDNLVGSQLLHVLWSNGVRVEEDEEKMMFFKSFPQEAIRAHLKNKGMSISKATRISSDIVKNLNEKDIISLSADMRRATLLGKLKKTEDVWEFIYNWMENKGKIEEANCNLSFSIEENFLHLIKKLKNV